MKIKEASLSISCVIYDTPLKTLTATLESLALALDYAKNNGVLTSHSLYLINNANEQSDAFKEAIALAHHLNLNIISKTGHGNIGYGRANNLAIFDSEAHYHLILNPDVVMEPNALEVGITFLSAHTNVSLIAPHAINEHGSTEFLAKRSPSAWIIFLRGINKPFLNNLFKKSLDAYTYKDVIPVYAPIEIELASGCFMLCKTEALKKVGGFSEEYFLYFEDFDLSRKLRRISKIYHHPEVKIMHSGGNTARKGFNHIKIFLQSYWIYRKLNR